MINSALKRDPESAQAEYFAEFREQTEAFLSSEAIEACIDPGLGRGGVEPGVNYMMAVDPALMRDHYAYAIGHLEGGVVLIDYLKKLRAPVDANGAEDLLKSLVERYKPMGVLCDNPSTVQRLKPGLPMVYTPFTRQQKLRIYGSLKESINLGLIGLPKDDDLIDELKALQIRGGVDISAPKAGRITHDDLADCVALLADELLSGAHSHIVTIRKNPYYSGDGTGWGNAFWEDEEAVLGPPEPSPMAHPPSSGDPIYEQNINQARSSGQLFWKKVKQSMEDDNV